MAWIVFLFKTFTTLITFLSKFHVPGFKILHSTNFHPFSGVISKNSFLVHLQVNEGICLPNSKTIVPSI